MGLLSKVMGGLQGCSSVLESYGGEVFDNIGKCGKADCSNTLKTSSAMPLWSLLAPSLYPADKGYCKYSYCERFMHPSATSSV